MACFVFFRKGESRKKFGTVRSAPGIVLEAFTDLTEHMGEHIFSLAELSHVFCAVVFYIGKLKRM
jgi:hypothetical protein